MKRLLGLFCLWSIVNTTMAQQNLFNIPSGDMTPKGRVFYQHQINLYPKSVVESKSHFVYGLGKGWEIGMNLINIKADFTRRRWFQTNEQSGQDPLKPLALLTAQKMWHVGKHWRVNVGTQTGSNITDELAHSRLAYMHYALTSGEFFHHRVRLTVGGYKANQAYLGAGNRWGFIAGYEVAVVPRKFYLMGDWISGIHSSAVSVIGLMMPLNKRLQICVGKMLRNPGSLAASGLVLEVNVLGFDFW